VYLRSTYFSKVLMTDENHLVPPRPNRPQAALTIFLRTITIPSTVSPVLLRWPRSNVPSPFNRHQPLSHISTTNSLVSRRALRQPLFLRLSR
jgi:hypothetical protein